ncbi:AraC family transcriptional regulator [Streptomyces sp. NPDC050610]|uniref:AraC family transcriptional regulator n=1 Tax=Streptomyces sp. NPDC050610 TaxID=3157097 RepID=UPI0034151705
MPADPLNLPLDPSNPLPPSNPPSDPLSHVLALAGARCTLTGRLAASGRWALRFPAPGRLKIITVLRGTCTFSSARLANDVDVRAGEAIAVNGSDPFTLYTDPAAPPVDATEMTVPFHRIGSGEEFSGVGGDLDVQHGGEALLAWALPPFLHLTSTSPQSTAVRWLLEELDAELGDPRAGGGFARDQIAQLLLVQVLRSYLARPEALPAGWLRAVADPRLAPAVRAMHENPAYAWQLHELARIATMARTTFAARFRAVAGVPPLAYLHDWRMRLAAHALVHQDVPVGRVGLSIGYASESSFSTAFKRAFGTTPLRYRRTGGRD